MTGILVGSQAAIRVAVVRFEKKSEGEVAQPRVKVDYLSRIALKFILDTSCRW